MSSIINEEIIKHVTKNNKKCTILNDDYVILYKSMEVPDDQLDDYFEKIKQAQASGINIPKVVEYKLLNESVENASKGTFIEERAKGCNLNIRGLIFRSNQEYNLKSIISLYLEKVEAYLEEIEKRASASQEIYNKFLSDFINLHKFGLKPDPNSLNYFFDSKIGYTIIDPYPNESNIINEKELFKYIMNDIYGVGRPTILIKKDKLEGFYYLPEQLKTRLDSASTLLNKKISKAFRQAGYSENYILNNLELNKQRFRTEDESMEFSDLIRLLEDQIQNKQQSKNSIK